MKKRDENSQLEKMQDLWEAVRPFLEAAAQAAADAGNHPNPAEGPQQVQTPQAPAQEPAEVQELKRSIHAQIKEHIANFVNENLLF